MRYANFSPIAEKEDPPERVAAVEAELATLKARFRELLDDGGLA
ncbi:MAG: hypothetical protein ACREV4_04445 [Gammaproteobacteria bacterium]